MGPCVTQGPFLLPDEGAFMAYLQSLDEVESVENLTHRALLQAIRDTKYSVAEISCRLGIPRSTTYYVINRYLPPKYLKERKQRLQLGNMKVRAARECSPNDTVYVVPKVTEMVSYPAMLELPPKDSLQKSTESLHLRDKQKEGVHTLARTANERTTEPSVESSEGGKKDAPVNSYIVEHNGSTLKWEGACDPQQVKNFCEIMREFMTVTCA